MSKAHSSAHNPPLPSQPNTAPKEYPPLNPDHLKLKMRLAPLLQVEAALMKKLLPSGHVPHSSNPAQSFPTQQEISVNSSASWKNTFNRLMGRNSCDSADLIDWSDPDDPGVVLNACAEDMKRLWTDPVIQALMKVEKMRPEEMAGLYVFEQWFRIALIIFQLP